MVTQQRNVQIFVENQNIRFIVGICTSLLFKSFHILGHIWWKVLVWFWFPFGCILTLSILSLILGNLCTLPLDQLIKKTPVDILVLAHSYLDVSKNVDQNLAINGQFLPDNNSCYDNFFNFSLGEFLGFLFDKHSR